MVRDNGGNILAVASKRVQGAFTPLHIEAMGKCFALGFIKDLDLRAIILKGDNAEVVHALKAREISLASVNLLIEDIKQIGNEVAHGLAKNARYVDDVVIWLEEIPYCVRVQVLSDLAHCDS